MTVDPKELKKEQRKLDKKKKKDEEELLNKTMVSYMEVLDEYNLLVPENLHKRHNCMQKCINEFSIH